MLAFEVENPVDVDSQTQENIAEESSSSGSFVWTNANTLILLDLYRKYRSKVGTLAIRNFKKMWEVISVEFNKMHGVKVSPANCENRWKESIKNILITKIRLVPEENISNLLHTCICQVPNKENMDEASTETPASNLEKSELVTVLSEIEKENPNPGRKRKLVTHDKKNVLRVKTTKSDTYKMR